MESRGIFFGHGLPIRLNPIKLDVISVVAEENVEER